MPVEGDLLLAVVGQAALQDAEEAVLMADEHLVAFQRVLQGLTVSLLRACVCVRVCVVHASVCCEYVERACVRLCDVRVSVRRASVCS